MTNATAKYIYDAEGRRVAKENSGTGAVTVSYVLSLGGDQLDEINGSGAWQHSNIFAMGKLYATYGAEQSQQTTRFHLNDWLGTRRIDLPPSGNATLSCFSYPFGDGYTSGLSCTGSDTDITEQHFTGKQRDNETGDDDFGARYYASNMGRFLTADEFRNDANPANPQSWNLYAYVHDNPMSLVDPNGEYAIGGSTPKCYEDAMMAWAAQSADEMFSEEQQRAATGPLDIVGDETGTYVYGAQQQGTQRSSHHKKRTQSGGLPQSGQASIYSDYFDGKPTASGETFSQDGYTAALLPKKRWHAVPLRTRVEITHDGRSVVVEVNDRGAGARDGSMTRVLDITQASARYLTGQEIWDDEDANRVGLITITITQVPSTTPLGPVPQEQK